MLESEYDMEMASEMEVDDMCNYSEYIENLEITRQMNAKIKVMKDLCIATTSQFRMKMK